MHGWLHEKIVKLEQGRQRLDVVRNNSLERGQRCVMVKRGMYFFFFLVLCNSKGTSGRGVWKCKGGRLLGLFFLFQMHSIKDSLDYACLESLVRAEHVILFFGD